MPLFGRRRTFTVNEPDPAYEVIYLGNVPTPMARGEGCVDRPLGLIWRSYVERRKNCIHMRFVVTRSGLKVTTEKQGVTEYWSHRITYCVAPTGYQRVFCWIYKHDGRRMKPELRCHAVLFRRSNQARRVAAKLQERLVIALNDYKRDKIVRHRLRTSSSVNSQPLRRQMLYTGGQNFRPPLDRRKSAPKLYSIEESIEEDHQTDADITNEVLNCLVEEEEEADISDSLYGDGPSSLTDDFDLTVEHELAKRLHLRPSSTGSEADTISDESGYIEEETDVSPSSARKSSPPLPMFGSNAAQPTISRAQSE
ncbi:PID 2 domain containing protein [Trichuris trichiura]|uniref:PID 2 domain containing protein n=1 Tax=Trichuris trichiura TaxID=36087 RepID=A0A077Z7S1_TRITR|nr:PID 2 domain containing protein [Trichuris trichiura]